MRQLEPMVQTAEILISPENREAQHIGEAGPEAEI